MPADAEFQELYTHCTYIWTTLNNVRGRLFTSKTNGRTLFFPAAGFYNSTTLSALGQYGRYWSATYQSETEALMLGFDSNGVYPQGQDSRRYGFCIRPVKPGTPNRSIIPPTTINEPKEEETPTEEEPKDDNQR